MRLATVSEVPTPWLCLQEDLRQVGIDPARLDRIADRSMAENLYALSEGRIEAAQFFEPVVEDALASGKCHLWCSASTRGRTSYTAFVTTRDRLVRDAEPLLHMVRAIQRTLHWIYTQSAQEIAAAISSFFPALDIGVLTAALARYQSQSVWGRDPVLPEDGFDRLRRWSPLGRVYRSANAIRRVRRQSFRGASPDRIDFGHGLEARADRHQGVKSDSGFICRVTSTTLSTGKKARYDIVCLARLAMLTVIPRSLAELRHCADRASLRTPERCNLAYCRGSRHSHKTAPIS